jgi:BolA family transcriptional regulator, general stress-responsive regulator
MSHLAKLFTARVASLSPLSMSVSDDSAMHAGHAGNTGGGHLSAKIVSTAFVGKSTVQRHRAVYALVGDLMPHTIHALSLNTQTPDEAKPQTSGEAHAH